MHTVYNVPAEVSATTHEYTVYYTDGTYYFFYYATNDLAEAGRVCTELANTYHVRCFVQWTKYLRLAA